VQGGRCACRGVRLASRRVPTRLVSHCPAQPASTARTARPDAFQLAGPSLEGLMDDIHTELAAQAVVPGLELEQMARYYFDGGGKAVRPCIAVCVGQLANHHAGGPGGPERLERQRRVAMVSEMIHTASLVHDDILDHAETRRGKESINGKWDVRKSTMCGDYILGVGSRILAQTGDKEVVVILSQVLADLVQGEFMQLQNKENEAERFEHYLTKSFNKTASLMAYSCRANALLAGVSSALVEGAFQYGRNIGIAFQLVDDLLDFSVSAEQLGKPAAADLKLGLATAPVLFAAEKFPELNEMIGRRFSEGGDVETAFRLVKGSGGLQETRDLARRHCDKATEALTGFADSEYKLALTDMCDKVMYRIK